MNCRDDAVAGQEEKRGSRSLLQRDKTAERFDMILAHTPVLIYSYKMISGKRVITYINDNAVNMLGYKPQEIIDDPALWTSRIHPDDIAPVMALPERLRTEQPLHLEYRFNCKRGLCRWLHEKHNLAVNIEGEIEMIAVCWDITERKEAEERIHYITFHDSLTGLYNRAFLEAEMDRLDTVRQLPVSIILGDLNGLKLVNDTYGHSKGDEMLRTVGEILRSSCRREELLGRWGGDEFVILLPQTARERAEELSKRIKQRCRSAYIEDVPVSLALGFATKNDSSATVSDILKEAEDLMYKQKLTESKSTRSAIVSALLKTLRTRSYETEEHSCRMQIMALELGEALGLPDSELSRLALLITLHDIGKINVPRKILTKKGGLTSEEWKIIKKHPETGFRITRSTEEFAHVAEDILSHHERWDGSGYPRGLKGRQIPFLARIAAIVDAYEVMTNGRPYRKKISSERAMAEISRCAGTQFDPELVELFLVRFTG